MSKVGQLIEGSLFVFEISHYHDMKFLINKIFRFKKRLVFDDYNSECRTVLNKVKRVRAGLLTRSPF